MIIQSTLDSLPEVDAYVEQACVASGIKKKRLSEILLAVNEAVTNSIRHGNAFDSKKKISIVFNAAKPEWLIFRITDEGNGFNWRILESNHAIKEVSNPEQYGGRGIFLMKNLSQRCIFNEKGNSVELHFKA